MAKMTFEWIRTTHLATLNGMYNKMLLPRAIWAGEMETKVDPNGGLGNRTNSILSPTHCRSFHATRAIGQRLRNYFEFCIIYYVLVVMKWLMYRLPNIAPIFEVKSSLN